MTSFTKMTYWSPLASNNDSVDKKTNQHFKNTRASPVAENEADFVPVKHDFSKCFSIPVFTATYKNIKKLESVILKHTRLGKPYAEYSPHLEVCVNTIINDK